MDTIALIPGKFAIPHKGHLDMVANYSKLADYVIVIVANPKDKGARDPAASKRILQAFIKHAKLPNAKVIVSKDASPVKAALHCIKKLRGCNIILGHSSKDSASQYAWLVDYCRSHKAANLQDPSKTAFTPKSSISSSKINLADFAAFKAAMPDGLPDQDLREIQSMLTPQLKESLAPVDETECIHLDITDDMLANSSLRVYNVGQVVKGKDGKDIPVTPKKFPERAVDICVPTGVEGLNIRIYLDTKDKAWDSDFTFDGVPGKLSLEQMGQFFNSDFYARLAQVLAKKWPLSDELYGNLFQGVANRQMRVSCGSPMTEDSNDLTKRKDLAGKDVDRDHEPDYTNSGRKIVHFSDFGVKTSSGKYYCWPKPGREFAWSQWKDWKKIKPLCRISFKHGEHTYGVSISTFGENFENRGFRGYDLDI